MRRIQRSEKYSCLVFGYIFYKLLVHENVRNKEAGIQIMNNINFRIDKAKELVEISKKIYTNNNNNVKHESGVKLLYRLLK